VPSGRGKAWSELFLPLYRQIHLALEAAGYPVEVMIGSSEFRLPVAIIHRDDTHHYAPAIWCDDGHGASNGYEDYVQVPNVLAYRRSKYLRVNARDWHLDRVKVTEPIRLAL